MNEYNEYQDTACRFFILELSSPVRFISSYLKGLSVLMTNAIEPLLSSINDSMEAIILTMHQEDFSRFVFSSPLTTHTTWDISI